MSFRFPGRADVPDHQVARTQVVAAQLCLGDVYILGTDAVIGSQKANPLIHNFENAATHFQAFLLSHGLRDLDDQTFAFEAVRLGEIEFLSHLF